ncbi:MAG: EAL domain-containing protein [Actinomycetota bacterium]
MLDISLPHSAWQIAAVPMGGWPTTYPSAKWLWAASVAIALLAGALVLILVQTPTRSRETVERATTALMKANEQLHTILEAVPGIVSWISSDLRYLGANRHLAAAYQRSPEDFHGQELGFLHGQTEFTEFVRRFFASSDRETSGEVATQIDDSLYNYLIVAQKYDQDRAAFTIGIDITQRQTAEAQLRASEAELRALFAAMTDVILVRDRTGRCLKIAPTNSALLYKPASEQLNATLHEIFDRETADTFLSYIHQALDTRKTVQCEYSLPIGGVQRWFSASISPMLEDSVVWVARDVTKYKHTEEALRQAEEKYRSIFENAVEGIFQTLPCGRYLNANPALARIYGYSSPAALMEKLSDIAHQLYVDPRRRDEFMSLMQEHDQVSNFESQVYRCDGQIIWISESARAVRDAKGELVYYEGIVEDITNRKQVEEQLLYNAFHDALTGLPNRLMFMDRLQQALQRSKTEPEYRFAVLFLDLDRFKIVNDSLGHMAGDRLLIAFAQRLETVLLESIATRHTPPTDLAFTIARLGGDEFTILLENIQQASDATQIAEQIHQALTLPFSIDGHDIFTTSSIGIVLNWEIEINDWASEAGSNRGPVPISALEAEKGRWGELPSPAFTVGETYPLCLMRYSAEDLLRDADIAMYRAKAMGKARHAVFNAAMYAGAVARLQLETDLRRAVAAEEFLVYYQPIVSLESGQIAGFEALVRWRHPNQGLISPASFIPLAEETGLIVPLGTWVLREACRQMRRWQLQFPSDSPLSMSVNLSGQQFSQSDLISTFEEILRETGLEGRSLKVEITESVITEGAGAATAILQRLRELGIQLCIDDFGTGYSSLSRLHQFPINTLKIDRSFVSWLGKKGKGHWGGMAPGEIVQTILMLAHNLGMDAIAEGVETPEQLAQLKRHRCEYGQGYLFSKPLCSEAATALLADWRQVEEKRM